MPESREYSIADYSSVFLQTNYGWLFEPIAFGPKAQITYSDYHDFLYIDGSRQRRYDDLNILNLDIGFFLNYSLNNFNIKLQAAASIPIGIFNVDDFMPFGLAAHLKAGVHYTFNK